MGTGLSRLMIFFFSSRRRHTRCSRDWSSDVCSSDLQQTSSQAAAAWMMEALHRDVLLRIIETEFPSGAALSLAGIIKGGRWRERKKALAVLGCLRGIRTVVIARDVPFTRLLAG